METQKTLTHDRLKTPRAAAVAGIVFSVLFIVSLVLTRTSVPADPDDAAGVPALGAPGQREYSAVGAEIRPGFGFMSG